MESKKTKIEIVSSQIERDDNIKPKAPADQEEFYLIINNYSKRELIKIGFGPWEKVGKKMLLLFPKEWYHSIPKGFETLSILGEKENFIPGKSDDDSRYGCLCYGLLK